jgi:transposase-like protein
LGYERVTRTGGGYGNSRDGTSPKTLTTEVGDVPLAVPCDRAGSFEPRLVPKGRPPRRQFGRKPAFGALALAYPDRLEGYPT